LKGKVPIFIKDGKVPASKLINNASSVTLHVNPTTTTTTATTNDNDTNTSNDVNFNNNKNDNRQQQAIKKKRERHDIQESYMKKLRSDTLQKAEIGSIVTIQMDRQDVPHPNAVLISLFKISKSAAIGCLIATEHDD
jgi:hypothetical protein